MVSTHEGGHGYPKRLLFVDGSPLNNFSLFCHKGESPSLRLRDCVGAGASADGLGGWGWSA